MNMSATARRGVLATAYLLVLPILSAAPVHGEPAPPPLPPAPGYPPPGLIVPGTSPPIQFGQPPVVGPLPPSTIDARGVDLSFTTDQSQPVLGMPGSRLGTPPTRIGIYGSTPEGGVSVGYTGSSIALEDLHGNPAPNQLPDLESTPSAPPPPIAGRTPYTYLRTR
jgi:hypothetical protein